MATRLDRLDCLRIVSVGQLFAKKNQAASCGPWPCFASGRERLAGCLGDEPTARTVRSRAAIEIDTQVKLLGWVSLEEVRRAYQDAHVGVLASLSEGFPKAVAESMEGGAVPVVSDVELIPRSWDMANAAGSFRLMITPNWRNTSGSIARSPATRTPRARRPRIHPDGYPDGVC